MISRTKRKDQHGGKSLSARRGRVTKKTPWALKVVFCLFVVPIVLVISLIAFNATSISSEEIILRYSDLISQQKDIAESSRETEPSPARKNEKGPQTRNEKVFDKKINEVGSNNRKILAHTEKVQQVLSSKPEVSKKIENQRPMNVRKAVAEAETVKEVSCGAHKAASCEQCVAGGHGPDYCNGDCLWCGKACRPKGDLCWHPPEPEPWFTDKDKRYDGKTLSVILPCGFEHEYFERTTKSVIAATPNDVLEEVIVLDDASQPPLKFTQMQPKTKVIRHSGPPLGLIGAKQMGAEAAKGDIVVFLDCHVKPALGWWEPIIREIAENPKRVVVPMITQLNVETWVESGRPQGNGGMSKCYLTLDGQFKWTNDDKKWVPIMSGGLLAMTKAWFFEIGGHDKGMKGWGGENLDLSLRIWRCGGEIVSATKSYVGHMWRDSKHAAKYTVQAGDVSKNLATAMMGHSEEYFLKKTTTFPGFGKYLKSHDSLNLEPIQEPMAKCHSFQWYLNRFSYIYRDAGVIPHEVFQLSPDDGKTCLQISPSRSWGNANTPQDNLVLEPCSEKQQGSLQWWHLSNRKPDNSCCSGLRVWNTDQCMNWSGQTSVCSLEGGQGQLAELKVNGALQLENDQCLAANGKVGTDCKEGTWKKLNLFAPIEFLLLDDATKQTWKGAPAR